MGNNAVERIRSALGRVSTTIGLDFDHDGIADVALTLSGWRGIAVVVGLSFLAGYTRLGGLL